MPRAQALSTTAIGSTPPLCSPSFVPVNRDTSSRSLVSSESHCCPVNNSASFCCANDRCTASRFGYTTPLLQLNTIVGHGERKRASRTISRMLLWVHSLTRAPPLGIVPEAVLLAAPAVRPMTHTHGGKPDTRGATCERDYCHCARNELCLGRKWRPYTRLLW